jgi:anti-anti-sigma factor
MPTPFTTMYVAHDVARPVHDVSLAIDRLPQRSTCDGVSLALGRTESRRQPTSACDPWRTVPASLRAGRRRPAFRVSLEALPWSSERSQIAIRPEGWTCAVWPSSFCDAAHAIAAHLSRTLADGIAAAAVAPPPGELSCRVHDVEFDDGDITVVKIAGDLHYKTSGQLREEMVEPLDTDVRVLVDLADLRSVDSAGLATLVLVTHVAERERPDATLTLTAVPEPIRDTIEISGYADLLKVA